MSPTISMIPIMTDPDLNPYNDATIHVPDHDLDFNHDPDPDPNHDQPRP